MVSVIWNSLTLVVLVLGAALYAYTTVKDWRKKRRSNVPVTRIDAVKDFGVFLLFLVFIGQRLERIEESQNKVQQTQKDR